MKLLLDESLSPKLVPLLRDGVRRAFKLRRSERK
jgi:predicted nuclease of predicted toxin-antitoxin system